jgi:hypothetical protein
MGRIALYKNRNEKQKAYRKRKKERMEHLEIQNRELLQENYRLLRRRPASRTPK